MNAIYTTEELTEQISELILELNEAQVKSVIKRMLRKRLPTYVYHAMKDAIEGIDSPNPDKALSEASADRRVTYRNLHDMKKEGMLDLVEDIVRTALQMPQQTREIILNVAAQNPKCCFIKNGAIHQKYKVWVGHILSMAGFKWHSTYQKEEHKVVKTWVPKYGTGHFTVDDRVMNVRAIFNHQLFDYERKYEQELNSAQDAQDIESLI